jgi:hypothetical protein
MNRRHAETWRKLKRNEELLEDAERLLKRQKRDKALMLEAVERCSKMPWRTLENDLKNAESRLEKAHKDLLKAQKEVSETKRSMKFCQDHSEHVSSWIDWATARHKRHAFRTSQTQANVQKLRDAIEKEKASIPQNVWDDLTKKEKEKYEKELREAQEIVIGDAGSDDHQYASRLPKKSSWRII